MTMRDLPRYWIAEERQQQQLVVTMMMMVIRRYLPIYRGLGGSLGKFWWYAAVLGIQSGGWFFWSAVDRWVGYLEYLIWLVRLAESLSFSLSPFPLSLCVMGKWRQWECNTSRTPVSIFLREKQSSSAYFFLPPNYDSLGSCMIFLNSSTMNQLSAAWNITKWLIP